MEQVRQPVQHTSAPPKKPPRLKDISKAKVSSDIKDNESKADMDTVKSERVHEAPKKPVPKPRTKHLQFQSPLVQQQQTRSASNAASDHTHSRGSVVQGATLKAATEESQAVRKRLAIGCTGLMYACQNGDVSTVLEHLRSKPGSVHQRDSRNKNALHYCAAQRAPAGDLVAAASIAIAAPDLLGSADEDGFTPLHLAVIQGNLAMVNLLLANKADVNAVDNEGHSVVHWATVCGEVEALRAVLAAGANVAIPDINGGSPLHYAAQMCGANYDSKLGQGNSSKLALDILGILLAHPQASVDVQDKDGRQPLLWAASAGSAKAVLALVKAGARVESADKDGLTALHCAASRGHTECIDALISLCGAPTDLIDSNGCTALHYAVTLGHADATSRLLDLEADPNRQDRKGRTPAHCGCSKGQFETVKLLKERGANLWLRNAKGDLPVHEAASSGRRELVEWLLEQRSKQVNTTSNDGRSLLHIAAANDYTDMCKTLLDYGADINAIYRTSKGVVITPLDCALQRGYRSTAKFLQSHEGLPASKLRLAARRANPFQEASTDVVRPLKYAEKEEVHDLQNSKKYVVYLKRSDSDAGAGDGTCSCSERTYKREQRYAHVCKRHRRSHIQRMRRRTSSCGEPKEVQHAQESGDICRSKSNIELRRRRKSRERYTSSSEWEEEDETEAEAEAEDSCENCCYHKRQKQRVLRRRTTLERRARGSKDTPEKRAKKPIEEAEKDLPAEQERPKSATRRPGSKTSTTHSRPQSATKRQTPPPSAAAKQGTFIKTPPQSAKLEEGKLEPKVITHTIELTDEEEHAGKVAQTVVTKVDVHRDADDEGHPKSTQAEEKGKDAPAKLEMIDKGVEEVVSQVNALIEKEVDQMLQVAVLAVGSESKPVEDQTEVNKESQIPQETDATEQIPSKENTAATIQAPNLVETPPTPLPTPLPSPKNAIGDAKEPNGQKEQPPPATTTDEIKPETATEAANAQLTSSKDTASSVSPQTAAAPASTEANQLQRGQESRRSFTLLPSDSAEDEEVEQPVRKSSFQVLKSDDSVGELDDAHASEEVEFSDTQVFKIVTSSQAAVDALSPDEKEDLDDGTGPYSRHGVSPGEDALAADAVTGIFDYSNGRKRRLKKRVRSGTKTRSNWKAAQEGREGAGDAAGAQQHSRDQDSGFEPSPRNTKSKIPTPRNIYTAHMPRRPIYATLDGRSCSGRLENRKPGDKGACDMNAVTRSIQRNIRRYYMERKIFQHLLELKSLQIRSNKLNEAVLVKRAVDDYHKSCSALGGETGTRLRRYNFSEYTFKNFELFLYETLKSLQKPGTYNFQNINEVYEEAERRLSPDYNAYEKALQCTTKTHRCLHAAHAYTGIPCAAYIPMMNHHTMPKFGFGPYKKTGVGSFYLPKILTSGGGCGGGSGKVALELSHGKSKQLISLPSDKLDSNKRYYVTFTVKESGCGAGGTGAGGGGANVNANKGQNDATDDTAGLATSAAK